jgi:hypothetical protein
MYNGAGRSSVAAANSDCALLDKPDLLICVYTNICIYIYVQHDLVRSKHEQYRFAFRKTVW